MTQHKKYRLLSLVLCLLMVFALLPTTAFAADDGLALGMPMITANLTDNNGTVIGFDTQEWYVIGDEENGVNPMARNLTLLHKLDSKNKDDSLRYGGSTFRDVAYLPPNGDGDYPDFQIKDGQRYALYKRDDGSVIHVQDKYTNEVFPEVVYFAVDHDAMENETGYTYPNDYYGSALQQSLEMIAKSTISKRESALITPRTLTAQNDGIGGKNVPDQKLWHLSKAETDSCKGAANKYFYTYWLRTTGGDYLGNFVDYLVLYYYAGGTFGFTNSGSIYSAHGTKEDGIYTPSEDLTLPIRPAFNLNVDNVLFATSASGENGKRTDVLTMQGLDSLQSADTLRADGDPIKFTMKDSSVQTLMIDNEDHRISVSGGKGVIRYSGAATGANQYVSCLVTDETGQNILYYGKLADCADTGSGEITIGVSEELMKGTYKMYLFSEQDNGINMTDFAGELIPISFFTAPGSLTISKTVSGNAASTTKEFTFIVKLIPNSDTTNNNIIYGNVTNVTVIDDEISFKLKAGDSNTINGLPDGIRYTVQELDSNGYTVSAKVNGDPVQLENNMLEGTIAAGVETKIVFNNHKSYVYPPNPPIMDEIIVEITGNSDSMVYDGTEHSVKGYTVKISDPRYTEADFTFTGKAEASGVNAGTYEMGLKAEQFKNTNARFTNVKFVIKADGVLTITPKDLTITAGSKTEYGPTPVTCDEWTVSGLVAGDKVESVKITGIQSVPGSSPNVPSDAVIKNAKGEDVTKNYAIKYVNGTLTMLEVLNKEDHFNYIIGTPEGLSLPTANVTRAEVATIFFRLMTDDARAKFDSLDNNFSDVAKGKWYNRAISTLAKAGIIKGDPAGTYRPGDPITRAEMAAIIARFGDFKEGGKTFSDISGHWAQKYIELAASNGWINGNPDGTFKPNNKITRAETVAMINRVLDRQTKDVSDLLPVSQMTNWSDNMDTAKWYYRDMQEATNNHKAERVGNSIYEKWTEKLPDIDWASYQI